MGVPAVPCYFLIAAAESQLAPEVLESSGGKLTGPGVSGDLYRKSELELCMWDEQMEFVKDLKVGLRLIGINSEDALSRMGSEGWWGKG